MNRKARVVFMGTPEFAEYTLKAIFENGYEIVSVVTVADKPVGRGQKMAVSPVKKYSLEKGLKILQPEKLKSDDFVNTLKELNPDIFVVVAFRMLPEVVWKIPSLGTFNLHASLLPQYRGAAPINHAIMNGETTTGITTFFINEEIDAGKILLQETVEIGENMNAGELHDVLMEKGAKLVLKTIDGIIEGKLKPIEQEIASESFQNLKLAPKIFKNDCEINWARKTEEVYNFIRGLSPYPCAFTELEKNKEKIGVKIFRAEKLIANHNLNAGEIETDKKNFIRISTVDGFIEIKELQLAGKGRLSVAEFLRGFQHIDYFKISGH